MKNILITFLLLIGTIWITNANSVDFYWEKQYSWWLWKNQVSILKDKINVFQNKTWLNTDIIILWKWDVEWCYNNRNFDSCVNLKYGYASDIIIVLKMKSNIFSKWEIRSYMDNKNYPIVTTIMLKNIQDNITYNFKNNNYVKWLIEYYDILGDKFIKNCNELLGENRKLWWDLYNSKCLISSLQKVYKQNEIIKKELWRDASFMRNIYILVSLFIFTFFMIVMHIYYLWKFKKVFNDIKFQLIDLDTVSTFSNDLEKSSNDLKRLIKKMEIYLANSDKNWIKVRKYYIEVSLEADRIKKDLEKSVKNYNSQDDLNKKINDFKNINI